MSVPEKRQIWILRDYSRCSGCRLCEVACSLRHEGRVWPEASRIRVFMLIPGAEFPQLCVQCHDYPCVDSCPYNALSVNQSTGAVIVDREKCTACGACIRACPGSIPRIHPSDKYVLICDLCGGDPECVKVCSLGGYYALKTAVKTPTSSYKLYAKHPQVLGRDVALKIYGELYEEV